MEAHEVEGQPLERDGAMNASDRWFEPRLGAVI
jgi:hypothetical protein